MRVLLSDGSGLTSRQVATQLAAGGHTVDAVAPAGLTLSRTTRWVRRVHPVPAYGLDPFAWLDATLKVLRAGDYDVLLPTQEQVVVLALRAGDVRRAGAAVAVPTFSSVLRVQDKLSAFRTLSDLDLRQPPTYVAGDAAALRANHIGFPVYVKLPIGTASGGVRRVSTAAELGHLAAAHERDGIFAGGGVLVQRPAPGPLVMIQAVFGHGQLVAFHANVRTREGAHGGASGKESIELPGARADLARLGASLGWHGALSVDAILGDDGPSYIDVNPRLVEPGNAWRAGVDLVDAMLRVSTGSAGQWPVAVPTGLPGVRTHQLLLAVLRAAETGGRRGVLAELRAAGWRTGAYAGSAEELTPVTRDPVTSLPVLYASTVTLLRPRTWRSFTSDAVSAYALTPPAWREILAAQPAAD